jgi:flagellar assembly protein FliH
MTSSPDRGALILRGSAAEGVPAARLDVELRSSRFVYGGRADARLVDPALERAFDEAAAQVRAAAEAEGYAIGWSAGHRAATAQVGTAAAEAEKQRQAAAAAQRAAMDTAIAGLTRAAALLEQRAVTPADELRDALLHAAVELAETLLGRELAVATEPGLDALRRALTLVPSGRPVTARLNPAEAPAVRDALGPDPLRTLGREVRVVADPDVEPAGCVVECDASRVDAQLTGALARVREVLGS